MLRAAAARRRDRPRARPSRSRYCAVRRPTTSCPELAIACDGAVDSVALFTRVPMAQVRAHRARRQLAHVRSALVRMLCATTSASRRSSSTRRRTWRAMLAEADAALMIGDPALDADPGRRSARRRSISARRGRPSPACRSCSRPGLAARRRRRRAVDLLHAARRAGQAAIPAIAQAEAAGDPERAGRARALPAREHPVRSRRARAGGLRSYSELAMQDGLAPARPEARAVRSTGRGRAQPPHEQADARRGSLTRP